LTAIQVQGSIDQMTASQIKGRVFAMWHFRTLAAFLRLYS